MASPKPFYLTNTATGKKELLEPIEPGHVRMYSCGPTVYALIHIGNLRAAMTSDLLFRALKYSGYQVTYVRNYTDVDDKIIEQSIQEKIPASQVSEKYTKEVELDYAAAQMVEPTHKTTVTGHIKEIVEMTKKIIENGHGYVAADGEVFFSIDSFKTYGQFSKRNLEDLIAGARVEVRDQKKNPLDFSLWKPAKPGEPFWESPWCQGRPGWHIECSAMASRWLGDQMDVHHGGIDLVFPHHENEIAQSEAASGKRPFVKIWIHNAFVNLAKEKMSKSLGNVISARDFLTKFGAEVARMLFVAPHYRTFIEFGDESLENALTGLERIYTAKLAAEKLLTLKAAVPDQRAESIWGEFVTHCEKARAQIADAYAQDLNTPEAMSAVFVLVREFNRVLAEKRTQSTPMAVLGAQAMIGVLENDLGTVTGIGRSHAQSVLDRIGEIRHQRTLASGNKGLSQDEIIALIANRAQAKKEKRFGDADAIRADLDSKGVLIKDTPQGTTWSYK